MPIESPHILMRFVGQPYWASTNGSVRYCTPCILQAPYLFSFYSDYNGVRVPREPAMDQHRGCCRTGQRIEMPISRIRYTRRGQTNQHHTEQVHFLHHVYLRDTCPKASRVSS